jgi:hypothetical protein
LPTTARNPAYCRASHELAELLNVAARVLSRSRAPYDRKKGDGVSGDFWKVNFIARALRFVT